MQNVHLLVGRHVDVAHQQPVVQRHAHAVVLEVGDVKTARGEVGTVGFDLLHIHPRRAVQYIANAVELEVIQLLTLDAGNALRGFLRGQVQAGRGGAGFALIALWRVLFGVSSIDRGGGKVDSALSGESVVEHT